VALRGARRRNRGTGRENGTGYWELKGILNGNTPAFERCVGKELDSSSREGSAGGGGRKLRGRGKMHFSAQGKISFPPLGGEGK